MADCKVNWYAEDVLLLVDEATDEIVTELAFQVEGEAKVGATYDTGFMRNAIYAVTPLANRRGQAMSEARAAADRDLAPEPSIGPGEAAVHGAAEYTIYQEMAVGFMYGALEKAKALADGIITKVGKGKFR